MYFNFFPKGHPCGTVQCTMDNAYNQKVIPHFLFCLLESNHNLSIHMSAFLQSKRFAYAIGGKCKRSTIVHTTLQLSLTRQFQYLPHYGTIGIEIHGEGIRG